MRWTFLFSGVLEGIWMIVDGFQLLLDSPRRFSSGETWNHLVVRVGLDPLQLGPLFLVLGVIWILVTMSVVTGMRRARTFAVILACASLWYAVPGTVLALINLFALKTLRDSAQAEG